MKKQTLISLLIITLVIQNIFGQVSTPSNIFAFTTDYVGWNTTIGTPDLFIKHELNLPIRFYNNAGNGTFNNQRMIIDSTTGFIGIGRNFSAPTSLLHINAANNATGEVFATDCPSGNSTFWRQRRGGGNYGTIFNLTGSKDFNMRADSGALNLYTVTNNSMNFFTNNVQRMIITSSNTASIAGYVGIGTSLTTPKSRLHLNQGSDSTCWFQMTGNNTGNLATDGLRIGVLNPVSGPFDVQFRQQENAPMEFFTTDSTSIKERFRLHYGRGGDNAGNYNTNGGITKTFISRDGVGTALPPSVSMLNIGTTGSVNPSGGRRSWMDVGTYYNWDSDNMYVGLKDDGANRKDAIINWGDDPYIAPDARYENLRFIFTSFVSGGTSDAYDIGTFSGLELMRMNAKGTVGIGPTFTNTITAKARLDIFDDGAKHGSYYDSLPQLRLSQTLNASAALGRWTDFTTTTKGDLFIHPDSAGVDKKVGINTSTPGNTLEINSTPTISLRPSGLRFTKLTSASAVEISPNGKVLTVDNNGDVVLTRDSIGTGGSNVSVCSTATLPANNLLNYIPKFTTAGAPATICNSQIYDSLNVSIGYPPQITCGGISPCPFYKLTVNGDVAIGNTSDIYKGGGITFNRIYTVTGGSTGIGNVSAGINAGPPGLMTGVEFNTFIGNNAGSNTNSQGNVFFGDNAGHDFVDDQIGNPDNSFLGNNAAPALVTGRENTFAGSHTASLLLAGDYNTIIGTGAAPYAHDSIDYETYVGLNAGIGIYGGSQNTMLGYTSGTNNGSSSAKTYHRTALGAGSRVDCDSCVIIGSAIDHVGIGGTTVPDSTKLYIDRAGFTHAFVANGDAYINSVYMPSDQNIKTNIQPAGIAQDILNSLHVFTYTFDNTNAPQLSLPSGTQVGVMADEVQALAPQLVEQFEFPATIDQNGNVVNNPVSIFGVNYIGLIPYLIQSLKHQRLMIEHLQNEINNCCTPVNRNTGSDEFPVKQTIDLASSDPILYQNQPNPFDHTTVIRYFIPETAIQPKIIFQDETGRTINETVLTEKGQGSIQVNSQLLNSGIYTYSLQINGKIIDSKKMLKTK